MIRYPFIQILSLLLMALPLAAQGQTVQVDTVESRCSRYYYSEWYDQCDHYIHPPDYLFGVPETFSLETPGGYGDDGRWGLYTSDYTVRPLEILGVAVMVSLNDMPRLTPTGDGNYSVNYLDSVRLPEYVALYQMSDKDSGEVYLIDSVRWDTAAVKIMKLPQNELDRENEDHYMYCRVYEGYFSDTLRVQGRFFICGSMYNNAFDSVYYIPAHQPTTYVYVADDMFGCDTCNGYYRKFYWGHPDSTGLMPDVNQPHKRTILGGPFLPIIEVAHAAQTVEVTARPNNPFWGTTTGSGTYLEGDTIALTASPADDRYRFMGWDDGESEASRMLVAMSDTVVTAMFAPVTAIVSPEERPIGFKIVPNPTRDRIRVDTEGEGRYTVTVYDNSGRKVLRKEFYGTSCMVDTAHLPAGSYLLAVQSDKGRGVKLFIKQ